MRSFQRLLGAVVLLLAGLALPVYADAPTAGTKATPAFWRVTGKHGTVYLLGSVHILPPSLDWHSPALDKAIASADVFAFELPDDANTMQQTKDLIVAHGSLPAGGNLHALLPKDSQADLDAVARMGGVAPTQFDTVRPWLADLLLSFALYQKQAGASPFSGLDHVLALDARQRGKELRYMETVEQQLKLIMPADPKVELEVFEYDLKEMRSEPELVPDMVAAWARGDVKALDTIFSASLDKHPDARKAMIDDRNAAWVVELKPWLDNEDKVFFVTVGAGHVVGRGGVPALLKAEGYKVEGPLR